jgi:DNA-binding IscR family transcriptional regulator
MSIREQVLDCMKINPGEKVSVETIAKLTGLNARKVSDSLSALRKLGIVVRDIRGVYYLNEPKVVKKMETPLGINQDGSVMSIRDIIYKHLCKYRDTEFTIQMLSEHFNISRKAASNALGLLKRQGLVESNFGQYRVILSKMPHHLFVAVPPIVEVIKGSRPNRWGPVTVAVVDLLSNHRMNKYSRADICKLLKLETNKQKQQLGSTLNHLTKISKAINKIGDKYIWAADAIVGNIIPDERMDAKVHVDVMVDRRECGPMWMDAHIKLLIRSDKLHLIDRFMLEMRDFFKGDIQDIVKVGEPTPTNEEEIVEYVRYRTEKNDAQS